ncbi:MAG: glycosyltransferase family 9 protein [Candidatus Glassbacteria bacterium]
MTRGLVYTDPTLADYAIIPETDLASLCRFLLIPATGIGDLIQFTPVIKNLKYFLPRSEISVLAGSEASAQVLARNPYVDRTLILGERSHKAWLSLSLKLRLRHGSVDAILASAGMPSYFPLLLKAKLIIAFQDFGWGFRAGGRRWIALSRNTSLNEVEENLRLLGPLGIRELEAETDLFMADDDRNFASALWDEMSIGKRWPVIAIHSQCDMREKQWGDELFTRLIRLLLDTYAECAVFLIGGPEEDVQGVVGGFEDSFRFVNLVGRTTILESASIIHKCQLVISNDSSIAHVAAAVGTPVLTIFGPTDPRRVKPWNQDGDVRVICAELECSPCYLLYSGRIACRYGSDDIRCMRAIAPEMVLEQVKQMVDRIACLPKTDAPSR